MRHILCRLFGHRRSRRRLRPVGGTWRSSCRFCGSEMVRAKPGQWRILNGHDGDQARAARERNES